MSTRPKLAITLCSTHLSWNGSETFREEGGFGIFNFILMLDHPPTPPPPAEVLGWLSGVSVDIHIMQPIMAIFRSGHACLKRERSLRLCPRWFGKQGQKLNVRLFTCPEKRREARGNSPKRLMSLPPIICCLRGSIVSLSPLFHHYFNLQVISPTFFFYIYFFIPPFLCKVTRWLHTVSVYLLPQASGALETDAVCRSAVPAHIRSLCGYPQGLTKAQKELTDVFIWRKQERGLFECWEDAAWVSITEKTDLALNFIEGNCCVSSGVISRSLRCWSGLPQTTGPCHPLKPAHRKAEWGA